MSSTLPYKSVENLPNCEFLSSNFSALMSSGAGSIEGEQMKSSEHPKCFGSSERDPQCTSDDALSKIVSLCEELRDRVSACEREIHELKAANEALASENKRVVEMLRLMTLQQEALSKENEPLASELANLIDPRAKSQTSPQEADLPTGGAVLEEKCPLLFPLIYQLKSEEERSNPARRLFFTRQSSNDLYGLLDPASRANMEV